MDCIFSSKKNAYLAISNSFGNVSGTMGTIVFSNPSINSTLDCIDKTAEQSNQYQGLHLAENVLSELIFYLDSLFEKLTISNISLSLSCVQGEVDLKKLYCQFFFIENDQGMYKNGVLANNRKIF